MIKVNNTLLRRTCLVNSYIICRLKDSFDEDLLYKQNQAGVAIWVMRTAHTITIEGKIVDYPKRHLRMIPTAVKTKSILVRRCTHRFIIRNDQKRRTT